MDRLKTKPGNVVRKEELLFYVENGKVICILDAKKRTVPIDGADALKQQRDVLAWARELLEELRNPTHKAD